MIQTKVGHGTGHAQPVPAVWPLHSNVRARATEVTLEDLDSVPWGELKQAHGTSGHVPDAILGLVSEDAQRRREAYWKLDNYVVLQSDLYEAAYYVIPFLLQILENPSTLNRREYVYDLLIEIANGGAPELFTVIHSNAEWPLALACRDRVAAGAALFVSDAAGGASKIRERALGLLMSLREYSETFASDLRKLSISPNIDAEIRATLADALGELGVGD